ncbi:MAG: alpha-glucosidase [Lachnospiraceae bacterium]|nr:alpha-glucosidase [Lachnospiraceae bacterium]
MIREADWYRKRSFYQIWVRSFADGNGDGIGDLYGVYEKLDYVKSLGVDGIWFSPLYPSPNADFGYDISDYKSIHPEYGDLNQFQKVLDKAHALNLAVVMDLVINHTSDEHPWFLESKKGRDNPYSDYYIWRDKPNNWKSILEGEAWEYDETRGQYYLHLFAKKQPDLNMDNPKVREEVKSILRFWLELGVDGFREDVITFISKKEGLPDGLPFIPVINGMPHYKDGPNLMSYLKEFREVCREYNAFQIGEGPMTTVSSVLRYTTGEGKVLDMMFSFDHMLADCLFTQFVRRPFSLIKLKKAFSKWQHALNQKGWNALYLENHDHPRIVSRYGSNRFRRESACMFAACYLFQKGTPFIYQGQEIGMTNIRLRDINHYADLSSRMNFKTHFQHENDEKRMRRIHHSSRDSSRTPMQWSAKRYAGFSTVKPWFYINRNYKEVNVAAQENDSASVLNFYRRCLSLRKHSKTLLWGEYKEYEPGNEHIYLYERSLGDVRYLVLCSFSHISRTVALPRPYRDRKLYLMLCNYEQGAWDEKARDDHFAALGSVLPHRITLQPYETRVYRCRL